MKQKKRNSFAVLGYTKNMMAPMAAFTAAANAIFAALDNRGVRADRAGSHRRIRTLPRGADRQTVLIIAHRMKTVDGVNKIVVLKDGRVAETGIPAELKKAGGIYRHMADMQLSSERWKYQ